MSLLESFIWCCERERKELERRLLTVQGSSQREVERLKQEISDLNDIIGPHEPPEHHEGSK